MSDFRSQMEREAWAKVEGLAEFTHKTLEAVGTNVSTARDYVRRWELEGKTVLIRVDAKTKVFRAAYDAPTLDVVRSVPPAQRTPEGNMWRTMRLMKTNFSPVDLVAHSNAGGVDVSIEKARNYCRLLLQAGYLRVRETAIHGQRPARYQLVRNTGPKAPEVRRVRVMLDLNDQTFEPLGDVT